MDNETHKIEETKSQEEMIAEIYKFTRQTKNYMKWQLIITVALVVIPLLATLFVVPFALNSLSSIYSGGDATGTSTGELQQLLQ